MKAKENSQLLGHFSDPPLEKIRRQLNVIPIQLTR